MSTATVALPIASAVGVAVSAAAEMALLTVIVAVALVAERRGRPGAESGGAADSVGA